MPYDRRSFLKATVALAASAGTGKGADSRPVTSASPNPEKVLNLDTMRPRGRFYEATVPDTLDLAERAKLAINCLTGNPDPDRGYLIYQGFHMGRDFVGEKRLYTFGFTITPKNARVLPLLRAMCGSEQNLNIELGIMRGLLSQVREDGLLYTPISANGGVPKDTSYPPVNGLLALAIRNWYERDGNQRWLDWVQLLAEGLKKIAIPVEDRAYFPLESGIDEKGKWHWNQRGKPILPYTPPDEPVSDQQGLEGAMKWDYYPPIQALLLSYRYRGDRSSLEMARRFARFCLKPNFWVDTSQEGYPGNEHAIFAGHFHNNTAFLLALLDLALTENDDWLKQFVREGYDHARRNGITRMGWFPSWITPERYNRATVHHSASVPDDIPSLGVQLSDAGLGDYWDDVDHCIRNQLAEQQVVDFDLMRQVAGGRPEDEPLLRRFFGGFTHGAEPTALKPWVYGGNTAVCAMSLYHAWHGITRFNSGVATVNLLLNRASPWMDIDSYLPYEGKVILRNKQARTALVRIPGWVDVEKVKCRVAKKETHPPRSGRYLVFEKLKKDDTLQLEFEIPQETGRYTIHGKEYTVTFRGSTLVDIAPRTTDPRLYPVYRRDHFKAAQAPMRSANRFVAETLSV